MTQPRRISWFVVFAAAVLLIPSKAAAQLVYTTVPTKNWVVVVDSATNSIFDTISIAATTATGPGTSPGSLAITPDAKFAYVVNQGCDASGSTVSVIDTNQDANQDLVVATIPVPGCPRQIALASDGLHGYVTTLLASGVGAVTVLDLAANAVVTTVNLTSSDRPTGIAVSPAGDFVRFGKSDGIYALATPNNALSSAVIADPQFPGTNCHTGEIAGTPDGNFLLVTCSPNEAVLLDAHTGRAIFNDLVSCTIGAPAITPDGTKAFVSDAECGGILDIPLATGVGKLFFLPGSSNPTSRRIAFTSDGTKAFASGFYNCCSQAGQADVQVFNPANDASIADVLVAFAPTGGSVGIAALPNNNTFLAMPSVVQPVDNITKTSPVTVTFADVTQAGFTSLVITPTGPTPPTGFQLGSPAQYYNISTTAVFAPGSTIQVCINYSGVNFTSAPTGLYHWDATTLSWALLPSTVDTVNQIVCGTTFSLSPFAILQPAAPTLAQTTTGLFVSPNPAAAGQLVTFTSGVSIGTGTGTGSGPAPTGSVTFFDGTTQLGSSVNLPNSGPAMFTISTLIAGLHTITAQYSGDGNYLASTSSAVSLTVNLNSANIGLFVSPPNPVAAGQLVTLTSGVSGTTGSGIPAPTGSVTFLDGGTPIASPVNLSNSGAAMLAISTLVAGTHTLTAQYNGDANYSLNTSAAVTLMINKSATSTGLFSSLNPSAAGQLVTFFAGVTGLAPTGTGAGAVPPPTGSITFLDNGVAMGPAVMVFSVTQSNPNPPSFSTSTLASGTHTITAQYSGDNNYNSSTSPLLFQTVNKSPAVINSVSNGNSANPSRVGQAVTFYSVVVGLAPSGVPAPTGSITFLDNGVAMGPAVMVFSVTQSNPNPPSFSTSTLAAGTHTITAQYSGDDNYSSNTSGPFIQTVNKNQVSVSMSSNSPNPSAVGQTVTFTAGVSGIGAPSGVPAPSGSVTFLDNGVPLGPAVILSSPTSGNPNPTTFTTSTLAIGLHFITAQYSGDATYLGSTTSGLNFTITNPATTTILSVSPSPSTYGQPVTFNATVSSSAGTPTGNVTFYDGSTSLGPGTLTSSGIATLTTSLLTAGMHSITASYPATGNFLASTSSAVTQTVNPAPLVVTADNKSRQYGQLNPPLTGTISGLQNGDNITATYTTTATSASPVGTYAITDPLNDPNGRLSNYTVTVNNGTLTITPAPLTITANNQTKTYGQTVSFAGTEFTAGGLLNADKVTSVTLASAGAAATATVAGSPYPVTPSAALGTGLGNYNISYVNGTLTVTQAVLTIAADNKTKVLNAPLPSFTVTYSGFVNRDSAASLIGALSFTTNATTPSPVGAYTITPSGQSSSNYTIGYKAGTLTIIYQPGGMCDGDFNRQILQPINADGTSVWKQGRTIPAKFRVCDANGVSIGTPGVVASFNLVQIIAGTITTIDETVSSTTADTAFRWDPTGQQWIFNISTANLPANQTYVYTITLNDGSTITFQYGLR